MTHEWPAPRVDAQTRIPVTSAAPHTRVLAAVALVLLLAGPGGSSPAQAQLGDPAQAKAVVACARNVSAAGRTYMANGYKALKKCVDTVFTCVELKHEDAGCLLKAQVTCDKQFAKLDSEALKLERTIDKKCAEDRIAFATLRSELAAGIDGLLADCRPYVAALGSLNDYKDCLRSAYECRIDELLRFAAPRAGEMLGQVQRSLAVCPTPTPGATSATPTRTPTPPRTRTPTPTRTATPGGPPATLTASATLTPSATAATPTATATPTPTVTATPQLNRVFVTSTLQNGGFGGLAGADAICAARAAAVSLPGTYVAWLSTTGTAAPDRLGSAQGFVRVDGKPFANSVADILANEIFAPLRIDENGVDVSVGEPPTASPLTVWTGTAKDGSIAAYTCNDWTSPDAAASGMAGRLTGGPAAWTARSNAGCDTARRLYCFQVDHTASLGPAPTSGKIAFVSTKAFTPGPGVGLAGADALCAGNAAAVGLGGTYKALLATTTASAASRMALAPLYVRPDGTPIATGATLAAGGALESGIWQRADGSYVPSAGDLVYTGAAAPAVAGTAASTCDDWSAQTSTAATIGASVYADTTWWSHATNAACSATIAVYCLEQ
ncbi:MAG: hypothetical protein OZ922_07440 [Myxococcales bacterium]|nr:hypothetical protein [Myxococcales bacterium]